MSSRLLVVSPVKFLPGRGRLSTNPISTGSLTMAKTTGRVVPVRGMARAVGVFTAKMASSGSRARSAARSGSRSYRHSAQRYSIVRFCPSIQP